MTATSSTAGKEQRAFTELIEQGTDPTSAALIAEAVASGRAEISVAGLVVWKPGQEPHAVARAEFDNALKRIVEREPAARIAYVRSALKFRIYHAAPPAIAEALKAELQRLGWTVQINTPSEDRIIAFAEKRLDYPRSKPLMMQMSIERPAANFED